MTTSGRHASSLKTWAIHSTSAKNCPNVHTDWILPQLNFLRGVMPKLPAVSVLMPQLSDLHAQTQTHKSIEPEVDHDYKRPFVWERNEA